MGLRARKLGGTILGACALTLLLAAAAQAGQFTAESYPATITGSQLSKHKFSFSNYSVSCTSASFHGVLPEAAETLTLSAGYSECTSGEGNAVTVKMTGCDYGLHAVETLGENEVDGNLDIKCPIGAGIDFEDAVTGCKIKILPQVSLTTTKYTNHKMAKDFDLDFGVFAINYTENELCPGGAGMFFEGQYTGQSTITGDFEEAPTGVTVD
ncbi:MAG TPA: hypothetical protein VFU11_11180 [Solirubrobacterales bacterium]|nr:hypothetical protein [Solirubrobacterales bacterium]